MLPLLAVFENSQMQRYEKSRGLSQPRPFYLLGSSLLASLTRLMSNVRLNTATSRLRSSRLKKPIKVVPRKRLNVSHSACSTTAVAKAPKTLAFTTARPARFRSRQGAPLGDRVLSAMRHAFGGHLEPKDP